MLSERNDDWAEHYVAYKVRGVRLRERLLAECELSATLKPKQLVFHPRIYIARRNLLVHRPTFFFMLLPLQGLKKLVYIAREDPTKEKAYKVGLKAEIDKVWMIRRRASTATIHVSRLPPKRILSVFNHHHHPLSKRKPVIMAT